MRFTTALFYLLFVHLSVNGQMIDSVKSAIITVLLEKEVAYKAFCDYEQQEWKNDALEDWKAEKGNLPAGRYAFIFADTLFQRKYKGINDEISYAAPLNGIVFRREFYKDSVQAIYVGATQLYTELVIFFKKIDVQTETASISFCITSRVDQLRFADNYAEVTAHLHKENKRWVVDKCKVEPSKWYQYTRKVMIQDVLRNRRP